MRNFVIALLALILTPLSVHAEDYYWLAGTSGVSIEPARYSNYIAACDRYLSGRAYKSYIVEGEAIVRCFGGTSSTTSSTRGYAYRRGDSCLAPATYNNSTGECKRPAEPEPEPNKCEGKAGQQRKFQKRGIIGDGWFSVTDNGFGVHPQDNCVDGCQAWTERVKCTYNNLLGNVYLCRGTANLTGAECGTGGSDAEETNDDTAPEPQRTVDKKPCVYKTNADGTQSCASENTEYKDGEFCAQGADGRKVCVDKQPEKNGIDIRTDIKTEPTPDGGSKTTKTDVTTKTECKNGKCSTSTTTRTTTTTKDSNGKTSSVSGTCIGKDCKEKNEDPDGNGSGNGTCTGANCSDDPLEEGVGEGGFYEPGTDTFDSVLTTFQAGVKNIPVVQGAGNFLAFNPSGSCPAGAVSVMGMSVQLDQWCGSTIPWDLIKSVVMAVAAFLAYRIAFL